MNRDRYDLPLTTTSDRAAAYYRDGVDCMLSAWHGAEDAFDRAIARRSRLRAGAYRARPRCTSSTWRAPRPAPWPRTPGSWPPRATPRERQHVEIMAAVIEGKPKARHDRRRGASRRISARRAGAVAAARRVRPLCLLRPGRPRRRQARDLRASRHAITARTGGSLSYLGWSHTEAGNLRDRPGPERTRVGVAIGKRQCRAWPVACDVRAGRHGEAAATFLVAMAAGA